MLMVSRGIEADGVEWGSRLMTLSGGSRLMKLSGLEADGVERNRG